MSGKAYTSYLGTVALALISMVLVACGGSGSTASTANTAGNGSVGIVLTDGPTADFAEVNVTITGVSLIPDDDSDNNGHVVIFQGEKTINLLSLTDFSELFAISNEVPAGQYEKIRLHLKQPNGIELIKKDDQGNVIETIYPKMTGNGKLDLNPRGDFRVVAGQTLYIQLDIDANKSLHIVATGNGGYRFRPVIFVDVIDHQFSGKLVRHFGYVHNLDMENNYFKLCDQPIDLMGPPAAEMGNTTEIDGMGACIKVVADDASVFDQDGNPADMSGTQDNDMLTAVGFVRSYEDDDLDVDDLNDNSDHEIRLYAEVIEMGDMDTFAVVDGTVATEPQTEADVFALSLEDATEISVQLQVGTKVFSRSGQRLDYQSIAMGLTASVDGVYSAMDSGMLKSSLVIVDTAMIDTMEKLHGNVLSVDNNIITISTSEGEKMIRISDDSSIFLMLGADGSSLSDMIDIMAVPSNAELDAYGHAANDGYFDADTVIIESPETTL